MITTREIKRQVRERDGYCCVRCGMTNDEHCREYGMQLHVHRVGFDSDYSVEGSISVCTICHRKEHRKESDRRLHRPLDQQWIGSRISALRERLGDSREQFAKRLGVGVTALAKWEKQQGKPSYLRQEALDRIEAEQAARAKEMQPA